MKLYNFRFLSLQKKILLVLTFVGAVAMLGSGLALYLIIRPAFSRIELKEVNDQKNRVEYGLKDLELQLQRSASDYATWDDVYNYMSSGDKKFLIANLTPSALKSIGMDAIVLIDKNGSIRVAKAIGRDGNFDSARARAIEIALDHTAFIHVALSRHESSSFVRTPEGIFVVAASQVLRSDGTGEPRGLVLMSRSVSASTISSSLRVPVRLTATPQSAINGKVIESSVAIKGVDGIPVGYASFDTPRSVTRAGLIVFFSAGVVTLGILSALMICLTVAIRLLAVNRVVSLEQHLRHLEATNSLDTIAPGAGDDELDRLISRFNALVLSLKDARELLLVQSYEQGKSDWASGALHNLRNALNPIAVLFGLWEQADKPQLRERVILAARELAAGGADSARLEALKRFLIEGALHQSEVADTQAQQMVTARECLRQVLDILSQQHSPANHRTENDPVALGALLAKAAVVARHSPLGSIDVYLPETSVVVEANEILLSQVLGNIFSNATESIHAWPRSDKKIEVSIKCTNVDGVTFVEIRIKDFGQGISAEMLPKIFERGFSTRKDKVGGLGLHWVANSINKMGGQIEIVSDGPGQGATVRLRLKVHDFGPGLPELEGSTAHRQIRYQGVLSG